MINRIGGQMLIPESITVCFLFDRTSGHVVHRHEVVNLSGATATDKTNIESEAYRLAAVQGWDVSALGALVLSSHDYSTEKSYKVDMTSLKLVELATNRLVRPGSKEGR
ncbi:MAG: hypothetical protein JO108_04925 [Acidobacteriaceae bacterium]|nr:hypothetical protein [Acidobacteriaceae bacterium]